MYCGGWFVTVRAGYFKKLTKKSRKYLLESVIVLGGIGTVTVSYSCEGGSQLL